MDLSPKYPLQLKLNYAVPLVLLHSNWHITQRPLAGKKVSLFFSTKHWSEMSSVWVEKSTSTFQHPPNSLGSRKVGLHEVVAMLGSKFQTSTPCVRPPSPPTRLKRACKHDFEKYPGCQVSQGQVHDAGPRMPTQNPWVGAAIIKVCTLWFTELTQTAAIVRTVPCLANQPCPKDMGS